MKFIQQRVQGTSQLAATAREWGVVWGQAGVHGFQPGPTGVPAHPRNFPSRPVAQQRGQLAPQRRLAGVLQQRRHSNQQFRSNERSLRRQRLLTGKSWYLYSFKTIITLFKFL